MRLITFKIFKEHCNNYYDEPSDNFETSVADLELCDNPGNEAEGMPCCKQHCPVFNSLKKGFAVTIEKYKGGPKFG